MATLLRDRMRDDMELAGLAESTREVYVRNALVFVNHFCRPPGRMGREEVRSFLLHLMRVK
jgi:integrase/recombinase XerD